MAIKVEGLSKRYRIGARQEGYKTLRERVNDLALMPFRAARSLVSRNGHLTSDLRPLTSDNTIWALKDVSFEVKRGEVVGIIGRNGAGKSTLLKVLSRITEPTTGAVDIYGRVGSLLEVGTGFHPELTGRENIFLNGAILGMRKAEIVRKFDEIVAFAEVEKFIDTPVKHYSSGMYVRLAFAVAAHLEPEILLVDEVLAVGDAAFQKKCLGKMGDVAKDGRTVLFVSHNMAAVKSLCQKAILLDAGIQTMSGNPVDVINYYLQDSDGSSACRIWEDLNIAPGDDKARICGVRILNEHGQTASQIEINDPVIIEVQYRTLKRDVKLNVSISVFTPDDTCVFASASISDNAWYQRAHPVGAFRSRCSIPEAFFNTGRFSITVLLVEDAYNVVAKADKVVAVEMVDLGKTRGGFFGQWGGVVRPALQWKTVLEPAVMKMF